MFCDLHGHSRKKNIFMYGCDQAENSAHRLKERIFPRLLAKNSDIFSFADCNFKVQKSKDGCGRVVVARELGLLYAYLPRITLYATQSIHAIHFLLLLGHSSSGMYYIIWVYSVTPVLGGAGTRWKRASAAQTSGGSATATSTPTIWSRWATTSATRSLTSAIRTSRRCNFSPLVFTVFCPCLVSFSTHLRYNQYGRCTPSGRSWR